MRMDRKLWEQLPVYRRLENEVKRYIAVHHLKRHDRLPSESQLAAEYGASIGTVRKALNNLVAENIIYHRHGQGTFVSPTPSSSPRTTRLTLQSRHTTRYTDSCNMLPGPGRYGATTRPKSLPDREIISKYTAASTT